MESKVRYDAEKNRVWRREEIFALIETYRSLPELWDPSHEGYKDRRRKINAIESIARNFETTTDEVNRKVHNLRTQLNSELRKLRRTKSDGRDRKCTWEFFSALGFLITDNSSTNNDKFDLGRSAQEFAEVQLCEEALLGEVPMWQVHSPQSQGKQTKEDSILNKALDLLNRRADDEQTFGDYVASTLRNMRSDENRRILKRKIQKDILEVTELDDSYP